MPVYGSQLQLHNSPQRFTFRHFCDSDSERQLWAAQRSRPTGSEGKWARNDTAACVLQCLAHTLWRGYNNWVILRENVELRYSTLMPKRKCVGVMALLAQNTSYVPRNGLNAHQCASPASYSGIPAFRRSTGCCYV